MVSRRDLVIALGVGAPLSLGRIGRAAGDPRLRARPTSPTVAAPPPGGQPLGLAPRRDGLLYVPANYSPDRAWPLVVALHGAGGNARSWASYPGRADALGFVLLVPESRAASWDIVGTTDFQFDPPFIDRALGATFARCRIDPARIVLAGFSDGASYALSLGIANGDLFSALVAFSPGFVVPGIAPVGRPRIFVSHGRLDQILPVERSRDEIVPGLRARGYQVRYREFDGGHEVPAEVTGEGLGLGLEGPAPGQEGRPDRS